MGNDKKDIFKVSPHKVWAVSQTRECGEDNRIVDGKMPIYTNNQA